MSKRWFNLDQTFPNEVTQTFFSCQLIQTLVAQPHVHPDPKTGSLRDGELDRESRLAADVSLPVDRDGGRQGNANENQNRFDN
jgi:hypothetical protein